jgi:hypothetical protein
MLRRLLARDRSFFAGQANVPLFFSTVEFWPAGIYDSDMNLNPPEGGIPMKLYLAVIADVIDSRHSPEMTDIAARLERLNSDCSPLVPFKCFRGDEIEAVLDPSTDVMKTIRALKYRLRPLKVRIGLGFGILDDADGTLPHDPFALNGEAFFEARKAIDLIKNRYKDQESIVLRSARHDAASFPGWDILLRYYCHVLNRWNADQWDAVMNYDKLGSMAEAANRLSKKPQSIQRSLDRARWDLIRDSELLLERQLRFSDISGNSKTG